MSGGWKDDDDDLDDMLKDAASDNNSNTNGWDDDDLSEGCFDDYGDDNIMAPSATAAAAASNNLSNSRPHHVVHTTNTSVQDTSVRDKCKNTATDDASGVSTDVVSAPAALAITATNVIRSSNESREEEDGNNGGWSDDDLFDDSSPPPPRQKTFPSATTTSAATSPPVAYRTRSKTAPGGGPYKPPKLLKQPLTTLNPSQKRIYQMLSNYATNLTNDQYLHHLQYKLNLYQSRLRNNLNHHKNCTPAATAAAELRHYYTIRPKLRKYTLGVELTRMEYKLILQNGKSTLDKDVIRSYFGVNDDGERIMSTHDDDEEVIITTTTVEELLIRSANQSLLADALVALTASEEDVLLDDNDSNDYHDDFFEDDDDGDETEKSIMGLILSGPTLCMTSVAESCQFTIDLQCGQVEALCDLAISVPFHGDVAAIHDLLLVSSGSTEQDHQHDKIVSDGRIILARAKVSVRFRPGGEGGNENEEPTVQYAVQSITSLHSPNSHVLRHVAIALAHDQDDPFFQEEQQQQQRTDVGDATDIRDLFLLNHHLLSDSGLLAVSDHLERLRGAAEAKSTGFRSALRQLDGVTNVSGKLQFLKSTANVTRGQGGGNGSGFLGLGLTLPSAEEIEAAEREAQSAVTMRDDAAFRFPRPDDVKEGYSRSYNDRNVRPPPPPPPPGRTPQTEKDVARPKPIIGGLFMSGLSRLAAAATQPSDLRTEEKWGEEGGTGLTPPSSPTATRFAQAPTNDFPTLYRREECEKSISHGASEGDFGVVGISPPLSAPANTHLTHHQETGFHAKCEVNRETVLDDTVEDDGGWSDEEFDFEETVNTDFAKQQVITEEKEEKVATILPQRNSSHSKKEEFVTYLQQDQPMVQPKTNNIFSEDFATALKEKIKSENREMVESGRLKRWTPLNEDPILRQRLMEVMVNTLRD